jgi:hypothetical protein
MKKKKKTTQGDGKLRSLYVFVDNSNLWIQGKKVSGQSRHKPIPSNYRYRIDYGRLLALVQGARILGAIPKLYGSEPPPNDSVWERIKEYGFDVTVFRRNIYNKEKGLDMKMGMDITMLLMRVKPPATIAIVAGDADYEPIITQSKEMGWEVEVWYWGKAARNIKRAATYYKMLDAHLDDIGFEE